MTIIFLAVFCLDLNQGVEGFELWLRDGRIACQRSRGWSLPVQSFQGGVPFGREVPGDWGGLGRTVARRRPLRSFFPPRCCGLGGCHEGQQRAELPPQHLIYVCRCARRQSFLHSTKSVRHGKSSRPFVALKASVFAAHLERLQVLGSGRSQRSVSRRRCSSRSRSQLCRLYCSLLQRLQSPTTGWLNTQLLAVETAAFDVDDK